MIISIFITVTILFVLLIFLIRPNKKRIDKLPTEMYAHRGLHDAKTAYENSVSAFKRAADRSMGVEFDVQLTKDNKLVVFHDNNLSRMTGIDTTIAEHTYEELKQYKLADSEDGIPLLEEVLDIMRGLPIICEIKAHLGAGNTTICPFVAEAIDKYEGNICIESFSPFYVGWFKKHRPDVIRGQLSASFKNDGKTPKLQAFAMRNLMFNFLTSPDFIAYKYSDDCFGFKLCRDLFNPVCVAWTARGSEAIEEAKAQKRFHSIIFEEKATYGRD